MMVERFAREYEFRQVDLSTERLTYISTRMALDHEIGCGRVDSIIVEEPDGIGYSVTVIKGSISRKDSEYIGVLDGRVIFRQPFAVAVETDCKDKVGKIILFAQSVILRHGIHDPELRNEERATCGPYVATVQVTREEALQIIKPSVAEDLHLINDDEFIVIPEKELIEI